MFMKCGEGYENAARVLRQSHLLQGDEGIDFRGHWVRVLFVTVSYL